ncbi:beta-ketoacyl synthase chain length factor [Chitinophaga sp. YIM B06452]|uniref:beta-ketoacyl synthase chain length factor n=1 Tax=Chitinophaga sp. YIM B06452 TaxID=3082158 RepID=UPI0031FEEC92
MKGKAYIRSCAAISPQESFSGDFAPQLLTLEGKSMMRVKEPDYSGFIPPNSLRRMSRVLKMGLVAALQCLRNGNTAVPGAIITGTGRGSLQDTEKFLHNIRDYAETALNPTPFIQSTYNSVNGLIALQQQCTEYNNTFVHRGFSFEHAVLDALMQLAEGNAAEVLAGAFDEITDEHFYIKSRIGYWKNGLTQPADLLASATNGSIAGEGSAFFLFTSQPADICLEGIKMIYKPSPEELQQSLQTFLSSHNLAPEEIDLLVSGRNGDAQFNHFYDGVEKRFTDAKTFYFKPYCGEYDTAGAFGLWAAVKQLEQGPEKIALLYNQFYGEQHTFMLVRRSVF